MGGFHLSGLGLWNNFYDNSGMMSLLHNYMLAMARLEEYLTIFPSIPHLL